MSGPALLLTLEKMVPAYTAGGSGRVFDPGVFPRGSVQPGGTSEGKVFSGSSGDRSKDGGEDGRVHNDQGSQAGPSPDSDDSGRVYSKSQLDSEDESHDSGEPEGVVWEERDDNINHNDHNMRRFGGNLNKAQEGVFGDSDSHQAMGMFYGYDPVDNMHHFCSTQGGTQASSYRRTSGDNYLSVRTAGGANGDGLLQHRVGTKLSGAKLRNAARRAHRSYFEK